MIALEPFEKNDFERLISWIDNKKMLVQFGGPIFSFPLTTDQLGTYKNDKQRHSYKVIELSSMEVIGHAELYPSDHMDTVKICRVLIGEKSKRGKGYGQQIINELVKISFTELNKTYVELNVYDWNTNAIKCYEKMGFAVNPNKLAEIEVDGDRWTSINMTIDKKSLSDP